MNLTSPLLTCCLTVGLLLLGSCAKKSEPLAPTPTLAATGQEDIRVLQQGFLDQHYAQQLVFPLRDHTTRAWTPRWEQSFHRTTSAAAAGTYIPLESPALAWVGVKKYLLIRRVDGKVEYNEASFLFKEKDNSAKDAVNPLDFMTAFSGTLRLKNLATGVKSYFFYQKGVPQSAPPTPSKAGKNTHRTNATNDCYEVVDCRWDGYCTLTDLNYAHYGSETSGIDYCDTPTEDGVGCSQIAWSLTESFSQEYCNGNPTGGGGGGGGGGTGTTGTLSIDKSKLQPCEDAVLTDLQAASGTPLLSILQLFAGNTPGYNWIVKNGSLPTGTYGATSGYDRTTGSVTTTFDTNQWGNATDLSIARTMLHEEIHAYLIAYFANDPIYAKATFATLVDAWNTAPLGADPNFYHHNDMAQGWVGDIAWSLKQYGISKGYNLSNQFYSDMAWAGLYGTDLFNAKSPVEQTRIRETIQAELNGTNIDGDITAQSGKKAGC